MSPSNPKALQALELKGCSITPLAHYLKALAVLRLVSLYGGDPQARGCWRNNHFVLITRLTAAELEQFFLEKYEPSPMLDPWNKGSGFFQEDDKGLSPLEKSSAPRFEQIREATGKVRVQIAALAEADKAVRVVKDEPKHLPEPQRSRLRESPEYKRRLAEAERLFKSLKEDFIPECRRHWRGRPLEWLSAALVLNSDGEAKFPSLLGTGGNDGRLDFCNNYMQRLAQLFNLEDPAGPALPATRSWLSSALFSAPTRGLLAGAAIGQFNPGGAGGANSTTGPDGDSLLNPWDFVLMMEGALLFSSAATARLGTHAQSRASAPFALQAHAVGYPGANPNEEGARGEQWMPLWSAPLTLDELQALLAEGRAQIGGKPAERPLDAARAISRLGVARGLTGFVRFGYLERNGQSNLAVPLGKIEVSARPNARLTDDLADWLDRLRRAARDVGASARLVSAERALADAVFAALTHEDQPLHWQAILRSAVQVETLQASGSALAAGPIPPLSIAWLAACDDGSATVRLAASVASAWAPKLGEHDKALALRGFWLPLDPFGRFKISDKRLLRDPHVVCFGRSGLEDAVALQLRLGVEAAAKGERTRTLRSAQGLGAFLADLNALLCGRISLDSVLELARAFMAIRWNQEMGSGLRGGHYGRDEDPPPAWCALKLCFSPPQPWYPRAPQADPAILRRLAAGDLPAALRLALPQQRPLGLKSVVQTAIVDPLEARLWAASLLFPLREDAVQRSLTLIDPSFELNSHSKEMNHADL